MLVYRGFAKASPSPTVLTVGNFDGMHLGHCALFARLNEVSQQTGLLPAALTFEPHPREFFAAKSSSPNPVQVPARLSSLREKLEQIAAEGAKFTCVAHFKPALAALSAAEFIELVLLKTLRVKHLIIGDDFQFGAARSGNLLSLQTAGQRYGFKVECVAGVLVDGLRASSSAVRAALAAGEIQQASRLLGHAYAMDGRVVHGAKMGRQLGFATANIRIKHAQLPLQGVFVVEAHRFSAQNGLEKIGVGVANLGFRPSINNDQRPLLEVHVFDFSGDLYGARLNIRFLHKLRDEMRFANLDALKAQISADAQNARTYFQSIQ